MEKRFITPGKAVPSLYADILSQPHTLIAGTTGSGKSTALAGLIYSAVALHSPARTQFVLIDPKRVDLLRFRDLPHTLKHVTEPADIVATLHNVLTVIDRRYKMMAEKGATLFNGTDIYLIIDEIADLMTTQKKDVMPPLQRILQIGRAAKVHVIACTQCPLSSIIGTPLKVNFTARLGLRTLCAQDSRNILGIKGCETLPQYGKGIYMSPNGYNPVSIPMIPDASIVSMLRYWNSPDCIA